MYQDHGPAGNGRSFMYEVMCEDECDEGRSCVCSVGQLEMLDCLEFAGVYLLPFKRLHPFESKQSVRS